MALCFAQKRSFGASDEHESGLDISSMSQLACACRACSFELVGRQQPRTQEAAQAQEEDPPPTSPTNAAHSNLPFSTKIKHLLKHINHIGIYIIPLSILQYLSLYMPGLVARSPLPQTAQNDNPPLLPIPIRASQNRSTTRGERSRVQTATSQPGARGGRDQSGEPDPGM